MLDTEQTNTNTGHTVVIEPDGKIAARVPQFTEETLRYAITPLKGATPYVLLGDVPALILMCLMIVLALIFGRTNRQS